ncbi:hypothetical protein J7444_08345 [Labrenzia sp. R4_1]|uniref:hypothetical protein n=1 Tax=Labrenzia sp. R4_1 TaxID=2821106 RepID=UPI001ADC60A6|nr:hypothetical protein [Labrenzia sp. R4_1]MBO9424728.1 hypothetical protein [Labrenzia sp. R4_1]
MKVFPLAVAFSLTSATAVFSENAPEGFKYCIQDVACDEQKHCTYLPTDDDDAKARIYSNMCKSLYGPDSKYKAINGKPGCTIKVLMPQAANC